MRKLKQNQTRLVPLGGTFDKADGLTPLILTAPQLATLNLLISATNMTTGATTILFNAAAPASGDYALSYRGATNRLQIAPPASFFANPTEYEIVVSSAALIYHVEDYYVVEPELIYNEFVLAIPDNGI